MRVCVYKGNLHSVYTHSIGGNLSRVEINFMFIFCVVRCGTAKSNAPQLLY